MDKLYERCADEFGPALDRLAAAYEAGPDARRDLLQDIHTALWRSLRGYDGHCSLRTWTFRVAHNVASTHVARSMRAKTASWISLEEAEPIAAGSEAAVHDGIALQRLMALIRKLRPLDRQTILLYLEGEHAASIGAITGMTATAVSTKLHRVKSLLARQFHQGVHTNDEHPTGMAEPVADESACLEPAAPHGAGV